MNRSIKLLAAFSLVLFFVACNSQQYFNTYHISQIEQPNSRQGFYYALPRNVITVDVTIKRTNEIPGPFAPYASKYLSIENVIMQPSDVYSIESISIGSYAEPDPTQFYFIDADVLQNSKTPFSISLTREGIITGINSEQENSVQDVNVLSRNYLGQFGSDVTFNYFIEHNLQERIDTIVERIRMDTVTVERRTLRRTWVEKSSEVRAREVSEFIIKLRNKRFDLITGFAEIPYSMETVKYMNQQMEKMESDYLELFTGISSESTFKYRFYITPHKNDPGLEYDLFLFDSRSGITENESRGERISLVIKPDLSSRQVNESLITQTGKGKLNRGIYYRIAEHARVSVLRNQVPISEARILISQLGITTSLPPDNLKIEFYPNTGTLKSVETIR